MADTITSGSGEVPETSTNSTADSFEARIDFVDITIYCSIALLIDAFGIIPGAGYVTSPLGIGGFRLWFWIKGINDPSMNFMMGATGLTEVIPVVSEIMPGVTAYVLTVCGKVVIAQQLKKVAPVARQVAKVAPAPQVKLAAAGIAAAGDIAGGQSSQEAVAQEAASAFGGGMPGGGGAAGAASGATGAASGGSAAPATSLGTGSYGADFSSSFDLSGQANQQAGGESGGPSLRPGSPGAGGAGLPGPTDTATGKGQRFAGGNPTSPDEGPLVNTMGQSAPKERRRDKPSPRPSKPVPKEPQFL